MRNFYCFRGFKQRNDGFVKFGDVSFDDACHCFNSLFNLKVFFSLFDTFYGLFNVCINGA